MKTFVPQTTCGLCMLVIAFINVVAPKGTVCLQATYARSPRIRRAN